MPPPARCLGCSSWPVFPRRRGALPALVQPLGAEGLGLTVTVSGQLKDAGMVNFMVSDVRLNHPIKPLAVAQTLYNAAAEGGTYDVVLDLRFGADGRMNMEGALKALSESAPEAVTPQATFGKPVGA